MTDAPLATFHVAETGQKRLELIGRTAGSVTLIGGTGPDGGPFTSGPGPHELLCAALSACTAMTMRLFAAKYGWPAEAIEVSTSYTAAAGARPGRFDREVHVEGPLTADQRERLLRIGEACPVGRTLAQASEIGITYRLALEMAQTGQAVS